MNDLKIFSGRANRELTRRICDYLGLPVGGITIGNFPDGEISCKVDEDIRGRDVFLVQPTCPPVNENLMELLIMIESCKRASAERITAVMPYYGYARQDRKDEGRVPITAKLVANIITRAGADRVLAMDLHAAQIQGFFDVPVDHLYAAPVLNEYFLEQGFDPKRHGRGQPRRGQHQAGPGPRRAAGRPAWRSSTSAAADAEHTKQENIIGGLGRGQDRADVRRHDQHGRLDLRRGPGDPRPRRPANLRGGHARRAVRAGHRAAADTRRSARCIITDTIPLRPEQMIPKIKVLSVAPLLGEAIKRIHRNESVSRLFD